MAFGTKMGSGSDIQAFFKNRYPDRKVADLVAYEKPTLASISKEDSLTGIQTVVPVCIDSPQGMSASLSTALANTSSSVGVAWNITRTRFHAGLTIDAETMMASRSKDGAFFKQRENDAARLFEQMGQVFEAQLWGTGSGSLGTISNEPDGSGDTATLVNAEDAIHYHKNMKVDFYADSSGDPSGSARAGGPYTIESVNEATGVLTFTGNLNTAIASGDHIVREGTLDAYVKGIPAWIPASDPGATTFFGVDRSAAPQKLAGHRQDWLGTIEETAKKLDTKVRRINQRPRTLWLSYSNFNRLELELGARGYRMEDGKGGKFGRPSLMMSSPGGSIEIRCSPYCPEDAGYLLDMSTWKIMTLGTLPHLVQDDGLSAIRIGAAATGANNGAEDGIEIRWRAFWQLVCPNPYANGRFTIS